MPSPSDNAKETDWHRIMIVQATTKIFDGNIYSPRVCFRPEHIYQEYTHNSIFVKNNRDTSVPMIEAMNWTVTEV